MPGNIDNQLRRPRLWLLVFGCLSMLLAGGSAVAALPLPDPAPSPGALPGPPSPLPGTPAPPAAVTVPPAAPPTAPPTATPPVAVTPTPPPEPAPEAQRTRLLANGRLQPEKVRVPRAASGRYAVVPGEAAPPSRRRGKVVRYVVEVERGLPFDPQEFADEVHRILNDPRGWGFRFKRVSRGPAKLRVSLSSPALTDRRCLPLRTHGVLSCWNGRQAVINAVRWNQGVPGYRGDVASYREYVVNHEVGHGLGHGHVPCPGPGRRAPVMLQQTKSLYGCRPNAWPFPKR
ncbi:DUF3152 domain-containing protein [Planomonospora parontospora]|uniref:DUF3152 domain-containing protein n=1 Tax=Planomonospora parontospora TaxID=58119 RepID=UPI0019C4132D|nr:DUF3152 domain-containing protein [Planomonospora parontospora]GGL37785.1 hypothetical protein GCM10014719_43650 [Planomonospora parontospora subsp. antibiotica]GII17540.1 hypothetical protein Ppa05_42660 [Planomonospora parontospora subsp. antibiotica]